MRILIPFWSGIIFRSLVRVRFNHQQPAFAIERHADGSGNVGFGRDLLKSIGVAAETGRSGNRRLLVAHKQLATASKRKLAPERITHKFTPPRWRTSNSPAPLVRGGRRPIAFFN